MKTIKGICIKKRNFDKFKKVADLIYFDGPLLSHYVTNKGDNYLFYWIDQDDTANRWMFIRTDYDNIQKYTNKKQTLRNVLSSPLDDIVYTVDIDEERGFHHRSLSERKIKNSGTFGETEANRFSYCQGGGRE